MASRPKPEKPAIFTEAYWKRPVPREKGDASPDVTAQMVGHTLSKWELADQALSHLFIALCDCTSAASLQAIRRAYGSIESNSGRRNAVAAAAEPYFGPYWDNKFVKQSLMDIINAVQWAAKRRDDIAHGIIWNITIDNVHYGAFLMPPEYNTGRSHLFIENSSDPLQFMRAKYRYTADDIGELFSKFGLLGKAITDYQQMIKREDGRFPALEAAIEPLMDESQRRSEHIDKRFGHTDSS